MWISLGLLVLSRWPGLPLRVLPAHGPGPSGLWYPNTCDPLLAHAHDVEECCLILLGAHAGLKSCEVRTLNWTDVQLTEATLRVRQRLIPKSGLLDEALRAWARKHGGLLAEGPVFGYKDTYSVNHGPEIKLRPAAVTDDPRSTHHVRAARDRQPQSRRSLRPHGRHRKVDVARGAAHPRE